MTKHASTGKDGTLKKSYKAEISSRIASGLAGFNPNDLNDTYYVPRAETELPGDLSDSEKLTKLLFPKIDDWKQELASDAGDHEYMIACKHFLQEVLPWLSKILVQDFVWWDGKYPQNDAVMLLRRRLNSNECRALVGRPDWNPSTWALQQRRRVGEVVNELQRSKKRQRIDGIELDRGTVSERLTRMENKFSEIVHQVRTSISELSYVASYVTNL